MICVLSFLLLREHQSTKDEERGDWIVEVARGVTCPDMSFWSRRRWVMVVSWQRLDGSSPTSPFSINSIYAERKTKIIA